MLFLPILAYKYSIWPPWHRQRQSRHGGGTEGGRREHRGESERASERASDQGKARQGARDFEAGRLHFFPRLPERETDGTDGDVVGQTGRERERERQQDSLCGSASGSGAENSCFYRQRGEREGG